MWRGYEDLRREVGPHLLGQDSSLFLLLLSCLLTLPKQGMVLLSPEIAIFVVVTANCNY